MIILDDGGFFGGCDNFKMKRKEPKLYITLKAARIALKFLEKDYQAKGSIAKVKLEVVT